MPEAAEGTCNCPACRIALRTQGQVHASDCAVHAGPAMMPGECSCEVSEDD